MRPPACDAPCLTTPPRASNVFSEEQPSSGCAGPTVPKATSLSFQPDPTGAPISAKMSAARRRPPTVQDTGHRPASLSRLSELRRRGTGQTGASAQTWNAWTRPQRSGSPGHGSPGQGPRLARARAKANGPQPWGWLTRPVVSAAAPWPPRAPSSSAAGRAGPGGPPGSQPHPCVQPDSRRPRTHQLRRASGLCPCYLGPAHTSLSGPVCHTPVRSPRVHKIVKRESDRGPISNCQFTGLQSATSPRDKPYSFLKCFARERKREMERQTRFKEA